jgi:hypothetical protein
MSRKLQFVTALLILSSLSLGTLNALPLRHPRAVPHEEGKLTAVVDGVASHHPWAKTQGKAPGHSHSKIALQIDPSGGH